MNENKKQLAVLRVSGSNKFIVVATDPEFPHLSANDGEMTEPQLKTRLAKKYGCSSSEIESLIREAQPIATTKQES